MNRIKLQKIFILLLLLATLHFGFMFLYKNRSNSDSNHNDEVMENGASPSTFNTPKHPPPSIIVTSPTTTTNTPPSQRAHEQHEKHEKHEQEQKREQQQHEQEQINEQQKREEQQSKNEREQQQEQQEHRSNEQNNNNNNSNNNENNENKQNEQNSGNEGNIANNNNNKNVPSSPSSSPISPSTTSTDPSVVLLDDNPYELTIVIPTVNRVKPTLPTTLESLFREAHRDKNNIKVIVVNGELNPSEHRSMEHVRKQFANEVQNGQLQVLSLLEGEEKENSVAKNRKNIFEPSSEKSEGQWMRHMLREDVLRVFHGDSMDRIKWRSKEVLDFVKSIKAACGIDTNETLKSPTTPPPTTSNNGKITTHMVKPPKIFLFLEDDTRATSHVFNKLNQWLRTVRDPSWFFVSLYSPDNVRDQQEYYLPCCSQAILFKCEDMSELSRYLISKYDESPIDWILNAYAHNEMMKNRGRRSYVAVPNLFQHIPAVSTYTAKGVTSHMSPTFVP